MNDSEAALRKLRREIDANSPEWLRLYMEAGVLLSFYRGHGAGVTLFRAYRANRKASKLWYADERAQRDEVEIRARLAAEHRPLTNTAGTNLGDQLREILEHLDPIVGGLVDHLTQQGGSSSESQQLADLRRRLRIGQGRGLSNANAQELDWIAVGGMRQAVVDMQACGRTLPRVELYRLVAQKFGIAQERVKRAWIRSRKCDPYDAKLEDAIRAALKKPRTKKPPSDPKGRFRTAELSKGAR